MAVGGTEVGVLVGGGGVEVAVGVCVGVAVGSGVWVAVGVLVAVGVGVAVAVGVMVGRMPTVRKLLSTTAQPRQQMQMVASAPARTMTMLRFLINFYLYPPRSDIQRGSRKGHGR